MLFVDKTIKTAQELLRGRVSADDFLLNTGLNKQEASTLGQDLLCSAQKEHSAIEVQIGLHLGFTFGLQREYTKPLISLAQAPWHQSHEDIVEALSDLLPPESADVLFELAQSKFKYRQNYRSESLAIKCIYLLAKLRTPAAITYLAKLGASADKQIRAEARRQLRKIATPPPVDEVGRLAAEQLRHLH